MNENVEFGVPEDQRPECQLVDEDGNVFTVIGRVSKALKRAGLQAKANEFTSKAMACESYDDVLQLTSSYVTVS